MVNLINSPDVYGDTIFCDDVRMEASQKLIYIGVYKGAMTIHVPFPVRLPNFCFAVSIQQRIKIFDPKITLRIFMPGDPDDATSDAASLIAELGEPQSGATLKMAEENSTRAGIPQAEREYVHTAAVMQFQSLEIKQSGFIKARADIGGNRYKIGTLAILPAPTNKA